ncbi:MAG TPA: hypothetical protein VJ044_14325, partial [Candidatus Hodarchaeales archaeon]|nr:hypothetical protein [Candidatus Hodarchaeales archaeon]
FDGLAQVLRQSLEECPFDTRAEILSNVIVSGGLGKLKGIDERIHKELKILYPGLDIKVVSHQRREATAWIGADTLVHKGIPDTRAQKRKTLSFKTPDIVSEYYREAVACEEAGLWLAAIILTEKTLKALVEDIAEKLARNVAMHLTPLTFLQGLRDEGIINEEIYQWGNKQSFIRITETKTIVRNATKAEVSDGLDFLQILMESLYQLTTKSKKAVKK